MAYQNRIEVNPHIMVGKPVIKGTRITVELVLRQLARGRTVQEILEDYPHLKAQDVHAAVDYAARLVAEEAVYSIGRPKAYGTTKIAA